jgi:glycopeptide antibiotics resistance protein
MLGIASIYILRLGQNLEGNFYNFYHSYISDLVIPFGTYFLLAMNEIRLKFLRKWQSKALIVFGVATIIEILQAFGIYVFTKTFDPVDILFYAIGAGLAALVDKKIFEQHIPFWKY